MIIQNGRSSEIYIDDLHSGDEEKVGTYFNLCLSPDGGISVLKWI